ncbi:MAG: hypothetical protein AAGI11_14730 [Pseudomonadota bacterium]
MKLRLRGWTLWLGSALCALLCLSAVGTLLATAFSDSPRAVTELMVWSGLATPVLWCLLMFYSDWDQSHYRPALVMGSVSVICVVSIYQAMQ